MKAKDKAVEVVQIPCWNCSADSIMVEHTDILARYECPECKVEYVTGLDDDGAQFRPRRAPKSIHMTRMHYGKDGLFFTTAVTNANKPEEVS